MSNITFSSSFPVNFFRFIFKKNEKRNKIFLFKQLNYLDFLPEDRYPVVYWHCECNYYPLMLPMTKYDDLLHISVSVVNNIERNQFELCNHNCWVHISVDNNRQQCQHNQLQSVYNDYTITLILSILLHSVTRTYMELTNRIYE